MRPAALLAVLLVAGACSSTPSAAVSTPATPSTSPAASASATPAVPGDLPVTTVDFSCRLPVTMRTTPNYDYAAGFIDFPAATYDADATIAAKTAYGTPFYDLAFKRWLPVDSSQSSPSGATYAYAGPLSDDRLSEAIYVVNVDTAHAQRFDIPSPWYWVVGDFDGRYVYLLHDFQDTLYGVWRLDTSTGQFVGLTQLGYVFAVRDGAVWIAGGHSYLFSGDLKFGLTRTFDTLLKVDVTSGRRTSWFSGSEHGVKLLTIDAKGRPVVQVQAEANFTQPGGQIRWIDKPGSGGRLIYSGDLQFSAVEADGDRLWLGGSAGIYLYTAAHGLQKVFAYTGASPAVEPAGFCQ